MGPRYSRESLNREEGARTVGVGVIHCEQDFKAIAGFEDGGRAPSHGIQVTFRS